MLYVSGQPPRFSHTYILFAHNLEISSNAARWIAAVDYLFESSLATSGMKKMHVLIRFDDEFYMGVTCITLKVVHWSLTLA